MKHTMQLQTAPFEKIKAGTKTIEMRLLDEKRRLIQEGDTITFRHAAHPEETIETRVTALHVFGSFAELYAGLPLSACGYGPEEQSAASPQDMEVYYPKEKQRQYGVVGIEIALLG